MPIRYNFLALAVDDGIHSGKKWSSAKTRCGGFISACLIVTGFDGSRRVLAPKERRSGGAYVDSRAGKQPVKESLDAEAEMVM